MRIIIPTLLPDRLALSVVNEDDRAKSDPVIKRLRGVDTGGEGGA